MAVPNTPTAPAPERERSRSCCRRACRVAAENCDHHVGQLQLTLGQKVMAIAELSQRNGALVAAAVEQKNKKNQELADLNIFYKEMAEKAMKIASIQTTLLANATPFNVDGVLAHTGGEPTQVGTSVAAASSYFVNESEHVL